MRSKRLIFSVVMNYEYFKKRLCVQNIFAIKNIVNVLFFKRNFQ